MFRFLRLGSVVASGALFASAAFGASISFNPASYGADPIGVTITLDDGVVSGATQITVAITDLTKIGDIRGVYFDLDAPAGFDPDADVLSVGGGPVTAVCEYTFYCGSGNFVYPWWNFDVALRIGYAGISGGDDYRLRLFR